MKYFIGSAVAAALLIGCAHTETSSTPAQNSNVVYLKSSDRAPAGAPVLQWNPATVTVAVPGASPEVKGATATVKVNQEMIWTEQEVFTDTRMEYQDVVVPGVCSDFQCSSGAGKSDLWDAFYSAPKEQKPAALNNAIVGVGDKSARALIANGYFQKKPRSWDDFSREINSAASNGVIQRSVATTVLVTSRYENINNLGYAGGSCREVQRNCDLVISKLVAVPFQNTRDVQKRRVVDVRTFNVTVNVTGALLLQNEKDTLSLKVDETGKVISADVNGYNTYAISTQALNGQDVTVDVKAVNRILRPLSNNVIKQESYTLVGDKATLVLDIDPSFVPGKEDPNSQLVIDYVVQICEYGWTGTCGFSSWKNQKMGSAVISAGRTIIPMDIPRKNKSQIQYRLIRKNSIFFDGNGLSQRTTDTVKMPK